MRVQDLITSLIGENPPVRVTAYDGTDMGPPDAATHIDILSKDAIQPVSYTHLTLPTNREV